MHAIHDIMLCTTAAAAAAAAATCTSFELHDNNSIVSLTINNHTNSKTTVPILLPRTTTNQQHNSMLMTLSYTQQHVALVPHSRVRGRGGVAASTEGPGCRRPRGVAEGQGRAHATAAKRRSRAEPGLDRTLTRGHTHRRAHARTGAVFAAHPDFMHVHCTRSLPRVACELKSRSALARGVKGTWPAIA